LDPSDSSLLSTPRAKRKKEIADGNRLLPFDHITQRKVKAFFNERLDNLDKTLREEVPIIDDDDFILEVPEIPKHKKNWNRVYIRKNRRLKKQENPSH